MSVCTSCIYGLQDSASDSSSSSSSSSRRRRRRRRSQNRSISSSISSRTYAQNVQQLPQTQPQKALSQAENGARQPFPKASRGKALVIRASGLAFSQTRGQRDQLESLRGTEVGAAHTRWQGPVGGVRVRRSRKRSKERGRKSLQSLALIRTGHGTCCTQGAQHIVG